MATASPFQPAELERAIRKLANEEPLTPDEGLLVHRKVDALTRPSSEQAQLRRLLRLPEGAPLPADVVEHMEWRKANVDNPHPVLRAMARAPLADEPLPPEVRAELDAQVEDIRAGRARTVPHAEIQRMLEQRRRDETSA